MKQIYLVKTLKLENGASFGLMCFKDKKFAEEEVRSRNETYLKTNQPKVAYKTEIYLMDED